MENGTPSTISESKDPLSHSAVYLADMNYLIYLNSSFLLYFNFFFYIFIFLYLLFTFYYFTSKFTISYVGYFIMKGLIQVSIGTDVRLLLDAFLFKLNDKIIRLWVNKDFMSFYEFFSLYFALLVALR